MTQDHSPTRRRFITALTASSTIGIAGCSTLIGNTPDDSQSVTIPGLTTFRGSGALTEGRPQPEGTSIEDLPDLTGSLNLYIGGGEGGIYYRFVELLQEIYPDFQVFANNASSSSLAQTIVEEVQASSPQADVFWSIDASSLGFAATNNAYESLPTDITELVPESFRGTDNAWVGIAGRARSIPYNTNQTSADDIPNKVADFPSTPALQGTMGWAPTYGAFKSFITAMRLLEGEDTTRDWLISMRETETQRFPNEFVISQQVADGALTAGFANHYYAMRVKNQRPDAPIDLAFTKNDAGTLVNVAGALRINGTQKPTLVNNFIRHLLSAEAQEFFATVSFAYPMISGVQPVGDLPPINELDPPTIDLAELANLDATLELMREAGVPG